MATAIIALMLSLTGVEATPAAAASQPAPSPPPAASPLQTAQDNLDRAQQLYAQTCEDRAYASYDDLCNSLAAQLSQYRQDLARTRRAPPPAASPPR